MLHNFYEMYNVYKGVSKKFVIESKILNINI